MDILSEKTIPGRNRLEIMGEVKQKLIQDKSQYFHYKKMAQITGFL